MSEFDKVRNFENVKVGDPVIYHSNFGSRVTSVARVTKTCFAVACCGNQLFNKDSGYVRGGSAWDFSHCTIATDEAIAELEEEKKKREIKIQVNGKLQRLNIKTLSFEQLQELNSVLGKFLGE